MTRFHLASLVSVHKLTPARRASALKRMRRRLGDLDPGSAEAVRERIDRALRLQREALVWQQTRRTGNGGAMHEEGAKALDAKLDKLLSLLNQALQGFVDLFGGAEAAAAKRVRDAIFPDGVAPITQRPFTEQHELLLWIVSDLRKGELAAAIGALDLGKWVDRLEELNTEYGKRLTRPDRVDPEQARAASARAYIAYVEVVTAVLALYPTDEGADLQGRRALLEPIAEQEEEAALLRARRRGGSEAGEVVEEEEIEEIEEIGPEPDRTADEPDGEPKDPPLSAALAS